MINKAFTLCSLSNVKERGSTHNELDRYFFFYQARYVLKLVFKLCFFIKKEWANGQIVFIAVCCYFIFSCIIIKNFSAGLEKT